MHKVLNIKLKYSRSKKYHICINTRPNINFVNHYHLSVKSRISEVHVKWNKTFALWVILNYSQNWVNDHLWITTTRLQRPLFRGSNFNFHSIKLPLNNDHLSTTATHFGSRGWSLYTGLTVLQNVFYYLNAF